MHLFIRAIKRILYRTSEIERKIQKGEWVFIIDPKSNFVAALNNCDLLITDQSSVLYEAALVGLQHSQLKFKTCL